jgi:hypothetical protein
MASTPPLHRGHAALLSLVSDEGERRAFISGGTVQFDRASQDFLVGWYEQLKEWNLIQAQDIMGREEKIGEMVSLTPDGVEIVERIRKAS